MTAYQEVLTAIHSAKTKGNLLSKKDILSILEATKSITIYTPILDSLIILFTTLNLNSHKTHNLTKRESQILELIGHGKNTRNIALKLNLSNSTIETHRKNIRKKLDIIGKGSLIQYAILHNLQFK